MAPANNLDCAAEPCRQWRYPKLCPTTDSQKNERPKSAVELSGKEIDSTYKKFCKFLRRLNTKKRKSNNQRRNLNQRRSCVPDQTYSILFQLKIKK